jgi:hypothetical protein
MACVLSKTSAGEFSAPAGQSFELGVDVAEGEARLLAVTYGGETRRTGPFTFVVVEGRHSLTAIIEASEPGVSTSLTEACPDGAQVLRRRRFDPADPAFIIVVTAT